MTDAYAPKRERFVHQPPGPRHAMIAARDEGVVSHVVVGAQSPPLRHNEIKMNATPRESDTVGASAAAAVSRSLDAQAQVRAAIDSARRVCDELERDGLALIERQMAELSAFNDRIAAFTQSAALVHGGIREAMERATGDAQS